MSLDELDPTDFETFCKVSDRFDKKLNKKIKSAADYDDQTVEYDSDEEYG